MNGTTIGEVIGGAIITGAIGLWGWLMRVLFQRVNKLETAHSDSQLENEKRFALREDVKEMARDIKAEIRDLAEKQSNGFGKVHKRLDDIRNGQ